MPPISPYFRLINSASIAATFVRIAVAISFTIYNNQQLSCISISRIASLIGAYFKVDQKNCKVRGDKMENSVHNIAVIIHKRGI